MFRCSYYASLCGFSQQSSEGDNRGHAGAVQEQERGQTLQAERICEIRQEVRNLPLHIQNQSTKKPDKKHQTRDYCRLSCAKRWKTGLNQIHSVYIPQRITCKINTHQAISFHQTIIIMKILQFSFKTVSNCHAKKVRLLKFEE